MTKDLEIINLICEKAGTFEGVTRGLSCNQTSFKAAKSKFLFIGPGPKGQGFKAMFKLEASIPQARQLAEKEPARFQVGKAGWVTTRFNADEPLPQSIWQKWLKESYELSSDK